MFFNRTRNSSASSSDPYTNLPQSPRARRATGMFDGNPTQPRDILHPKNTTPRRDSISIPYESPSATSHSLKRHSDPSPSIPSTITYPHHTPTRARFSPLPSTLPSDVQVQIDIERDRMSSPRSSQLRPPQQLNQLTAPLSPMRRNRSPTSRLPQPQHQRGRPDQRSEPHHPSSSAPPSAKRNSSPHPPPRPASESNIKPSTPYHHPKKDPRLLLGDLRRLLRPSMHHLIRDHLDVDDLLALHDRDLMERDERAAVRARVKECQGMQGWEKNDGLAVFSVKLREVLMYASTTAILGGYEHDLPVVVFACIEELYRTGIYQKNLFRALPHRARLLHLIDAFDSQPHFGVHTPLHTESMPDICALLSTYLSSLPEPVLSSALFEAVWAWCVWPSLEREEKVEQFFSTRDGEQESEARGASPVAVEDEDEATQICLARLLLNLLPSANSSLMVYLLAFFSQVPLAPENGIAVEDLGRMFGVPVFGGSVKSARRSEGTIKDRESGDGRESVTDGREGRAGVMMVWFMTRWRRISDGLFEDEGHGGAAQEREVQLKYVDVGGLSGWMPSQHAPGDFFGSSPALSSSDPVSRPSSFTDSDDSFTPLPLLLARPLDLKVKGKARAIEADGDFVSLIQNDRVEVRDPDLMPSDGLFEMDKISFGRDSENASLCSTPSLVERLLDITLPPPELLKNNTAMTSDSGSDDGSESDSVPDHNHTTRSRQPSAKSELVQARRQILRLESELERSDIAVADAIQQTFDARNKARLLEEQIRELETKQEKALAMVDWNAVLEGDNETLKRNLEVAVRERDKAWALVGDIRRLVEV